MSTNLLMISILSSSLFLVGAQSGSTATAQARPPDKPYMLIFAGVFVVIIMTTLILRHYISERCPVVRRSDQIPDASVSAGFNPSQLPSVKYAEAKKAAHSSSITIADHCSVCLNAFEDVQTLRLMPKCVHVFHKNCVDAWLSTHTTCPYCRADLVSSSSTSLKVKPPTATSNDVVLQIG